VVDVANSPSSKESRGRRKRIQHHASIHVEWLGRALGMSTISATLPRRANTAP
jgi:hypothetical protein